VPGHSAGRDRCAGRDRLKKFLSLLPIKSGNGMLHRTVLYQYFRRMFIFKPADHPFKGDLRIAFEYPAQPIFRDITPEGGAVPGMTAPEGPRFATKRRLRDVHGLAVGRSIPRRPRPERLHEKHDPAMP
jgi:hypothetical protein